MKTNRRHRGVTLIEIAMVIAVVSILVALAMPAVKTLTESIQSESSGTKLMVESILKNARALAIREQRYAGVRFQTAYQDENSQYMILVVHDRNDTGGLAKGFKAVQGTKPVKLPKNLIFEDHSQNTTFSVAFSPSGNNVIINMRVSDDKSKNDKDDIFNTEAQIDSGIGMFVVDGANALSVNSFRFGTAKDYYISAYGGLIESEYVQ